MRWEIINHLIKEYSYKTYLEIGYYKGWSFDRIECETKQAVDPNPCKTSDQEKLFSAANWPWHLEEGGTLVKSTSDDYFGESSESVKWDIIFVDGLHESQQVDRDIQNALKHLSPGGVIVMHDCNPSSYEMTTTGTASGEWTGDVYKSATKLLDAFGYNEFYVVNTDYGVGVLRPKGPSWNYEASIYDLATWDEFCNDREGHINLISPEEFLKRETNVKTTTTDNLPA